MSTTSPKLTHHYGRGGAGNVTSKEGAVSEAQKTTPILKSEKYTTGRGGAGNMATLDDPNKARESQDVDVPPILLPEGRNRTGRGGAANVYKPNHDEVAKARLHNERVRQENLAKKEPSVKQNGMDTARETVRGNRE